VIMTTGTVLSRQATEHMTPEGGVAPVRTGSASEQAPPIRTLVDAERAHISATLRETNGVIGGPRGAAVQLGLPRTTLIARMQRLGISSGAPEQRAGQSNRQFMGGNSTPTAVYPV
jgi:formate hydrogenlyase transcriptional activator